MKTQDKILNGLFILVLVPLFIFCINWIHREPIKFTNFGHSFFSIGIILLFILVTVSLVSLPIKLMKGDFNRTIRLGQILVLLGPLSAFFIYFFHVILNSLGIYRVEGLAWLGVFLLVLSIMILISIIGIVIFIIGLFKDSDNLK